MLPAEHEAQLQASLDRWGITTQSAKFRLLPSSQEDQGLATDNSIVYIAYGHYDWTGNGET